MDGNGNFRLTDGMIRTNPVFALSIWARTVWRSDNAGASRRCVAKKLAQWVDAGVCWPTHGVPQLVAAGLIPELFNLAFQTPCPRIVGLLYDPLHKVGLVNPLVTNVFDDLRNSSLLPFTAEGIRSLLLRLCDCSNQALSGGIPESAGFTFDESLGEHCLGNSMDVAGLLSALDALSGKVCPVLSAACAVVEPGLNATLNPVSRIPEKLDAFLREYGSGTLLVTTADCQQSEPFHDKFATVWSVNTLGELADKIARIDEVRNELTRSGPLNARQTNAILGQLGYLIDHERSYHEAIHLCDRVQTNGFAADVTQFKRLKVQRQHADALRHSGRFQESLEIVRGMQTMLDGCREALSYEDEARHAVVNASALFDACGFQAAADWLQESLTVCRNAPKSFSAQQRIEVMNTLARAFVMLDQDGWEELFDDSIRLQRIFDPHNVRRTESYLVHALLRAGRLPEAAAIIERHEVGLSDTFSNGFTTFYRCELSRRLGQMSPPPQACSSSYTSAFSIQACARQRGRTTEERLQLLKTAEQILRRLSNGNGSGNLLALIAEAVTLTSAAYTKDAGQWVHAIICFSENARVFGPMAVQYFGPVVDSLGCVPSEEGSERLLRRIPYL